jgi:membrane-associated protein
MTHVLLAPMLFGIKWLDPDWMLEQFGSGFFWVSLAIIVVECGLFFPFLPGDALLDLAVACVLLVGAAFLGNVVGFEIGNKLGPVIYEHDGKVLKRDYFDRTEAFFDKHGRKSLVIGRFVPVVRTYVTVVAGASKMKRPRFLAWSLIGALLWVLSITLAGYFVGDSFPWLAHHIDYLILGLLALTIVPAGIHWWRERSSSGSS